MALRLADDWVWDSWVADDGDDFHLFFLHAARSLADLTLRHHRAAIGHAVSKDLRTWRRLPDALVASGGPAWDDMATWTGSVVRGPDGLWRMFYTGLSQAEAGLVQRIGVATSPDLMTWTRDASFPQLEADARWYEKLGLNDVWHEEAWRDPFVFADPVGDGWHMLITARAPSGPADGRGVIGHAHSADLRDWRVLPPLTAPVGFGHLEVPQSRFVDGTPILVFSCQPPYLSAARQAKTRVGEVWTVRGESLLGPWHVDRAEPFPHPSLYAGQLLQDRRGRWLLLGFRDIENGAFVGEIVDPVPVRLDGNAETIVIDQPNSLSSALSVTSQEVAIVRRYLVVANQTLGGDELVQAVRERMVRGPSEFWVLVPATPPAFFATGHGTVANDELLGNSGESVAQHQLDVELQRLHEAGADADGEVGDEDPWKAIGDTLKRRKFDEIILSTLPKQRSRWLRQDLPSKIQKKYSIPLTHIVTAYSHW